MSNDVGYHQGYDHNEWYTQQPQNDWHCRLRCMIRSISFVEEQRIPPNFCSVVALETAARLTLNGRRWGFDLTQTDKNLGTLFNE